MISTLQSWIENAAEEYSREFKAESSPERPWSGPIELDAGFFYCPYVPLMTPPASSLNQVAPQGINFKTRYGVIKC